MARKTAANVAKKWATNMQAATTAMKDGVNGVTVSPTSKAADNVEKWLAGVQRARQEGTFEAGLRGVSLESWRQAMLQKGIPRISSGVTEATPKMERFLGELLSHTDSVSQQIQAMPSNTPEERKQRMLRNFELMSEFRSSRRRG